MRYSKNISIGIVLGLLTLCAGIQPADALILVEQQVKIRAIWQEGQLVAYKLRYRNPKRDSNYGKISGLIDRVDLNQKQLQIGPVSVTWNNDTQFKEMVESALTDRTLVKVSGWQTGPGEVTAKRIEPGPSDMDPTTIVVQGEVSSIKRLANENFQLSVLGTDILVPFQLLSPATTLTRRQGDRRPADQLKIDIFNRPLTIGGEIGLTPRYRGNFNLDPESNDNRARLDTEAQIELLYPWSYNLAVFLEGQASYTQEFYRGNNRRLRSEVEVQRGETWVFWGDIAESGFSLQLGRQNFRDPREWWWDNNLDALRLYYNRPFFRFELGVSEQLLPVSTLDFGIPAEEQNVFRVLSRTDWEWSAKQRLSLFFLHQQDHSTRDAVDDVIQDIFLDPVDGNFTWLGLRTMNRWELRNWGEFDFWADGAWINGDENTVEVDETDIEGISQVTDLNSKHVSGWGLDVGLTWETPLSWRPALTLGYAVGTREFRQTGLQDNNDRFRNISRFRYYGELLRPELSNLQIYTFIATVPILLNSSISAVYHYYRQVDARPFLRQGRINEDPNGINPGIGQEWDLIVSLEEWQNWEFELVGSVFRAGPAYGDFAGNTAVNTVLKVNYNF